MKKIILSIFIFMFYYTSYACMPFSPAEIIIWTYEWKETRIHPDKNFREWRNIEFIKISNTKKPFWANYNKIWKYYFLHSDNNDVNFDLNNYKIWDSIIMISNYNNWNYEDYFAVYEIGKLARKTDWKLDIIDMQWVKKDWWKAMWQCWNYKPEWVMNKNKLLSDLEYFIDVWVPVNNSNNDNKLYLYIMLSVFIIIIPIIYKYVKK